MRYAPGMAEATVLYERHEHPPWEREEITQMEALLLRAGYENPPGLAKLLKQQGMSPSELAWRLGAGQRVDRHHASEELDHSALGEIPAPAAAAAVTTTTVVAAAAEEKKPRRSKKACATCKPDVDLVVDPARHAVCAAVAKRLGAIDTPAKVYALLGPYMEGKDQEVVLVLLLNVHFRYIGLAEVAKGQRARVAVDKVDILRPVLASGAKAFCISHCHPSSLAKPSDADRALTRDLEKATKLFHKEITFLDHVVIGKGEYFSIRENKLHKA